MNELYWITRIGALNGLGVLLIIFSIVFAFVILCIASSEDRLEYLHKEWYAVCAFTIGVLILIFVPTKEEAFLIYGVGGTIDYIKSNDTAKQIPDKVIKACDIWISKLVEEETK